MEQMGKDDLIEAEGIVTAARGNGCFAVRLDLTDGEINCKIAGKLRKNTIRVLVGDRVKVSLSPYDLSHGFITYRMK